MLSARPSGDEPHHLGSVANPLQFYPLYALWPTPLSFTLSTPAPALTSPIQASCLATQALEGPLSHPFRIIFLTTAACPLPSPPTFPLLTLLTPSSPHISSHTSQEPACSIPHTK
eukprot:38880-Chlamydomonas_euryale.AAC.1